MNTKKFVICKTLDKYDTTTRFKKTKKVIDQYAHNNTFYGVLGINSRNPAVMTSRLLHEAIYHTSDELEKVLAILLRQNYITIDNPPQIVEIKNKKLCI